MSDPNDGPKNSTNVRDAIRVPAPWPVRAAITAAAWIAPDLTARALLGHFLRTRRPARRRTPWIGGGEALPLRSGWDHARAHVAGRGPAVHLLHGWDGSADDWRTIGPALIAAGYRVIALEAPGHGEADGNRAHLRAFADTLSASIGRFGPGPVVAHSMGAAAAGIAVDEGAAASSLTFVAPEVDPALWLLGAGSLGGPRLQAAVLRGMTRILGRPADAVGLASTLRSPVFAVHDTDDRQVSFRRVERVLPSAWRTSGLGHRGVLHHASVVSAIVDHVRGRPVSAGSGCPHRALTCPTCELSRSLFDRDARAA